MTLNEKLAALRREQGLSQEDLAGRLEVSRQAVSKWETGASAPDLEKLLALSDLFAVSADDLLRDEETVPFPIGPARESPASLPASPAPAPKKGLALWIVGWVTGGLGMLGIVVLWVLSTMIEIRVPSASTDADGMTWYTSVEGFAFWPFIETYRLQAVFFLFLILFCVGGFLLWMAWRRKKDGEQVQG